MDWETEELLQRNEHVLALQRAVQNERRSPELLVFYDTKTVERILANQLDKLTSVGGEWKEVYQLDIDRVSYMLKMYYRLRVLKINKFHRYYNEHNSEYLSAAEKRLALKLDQLEQKHMNDSFLHCFQGNGEFQSINKDPEMSMVAQPNTNVFCFYRALDPIGTIAAADSSGSLVLEDKGVYLGKYEHIADLLKAGRVELI